MPCFIFLLDSNWGHNLQNKYKINTKIFTEVEAWVQSVIYPLTDVQASTLWLVTLSTHLSIKVTTPNLKFNKIQEWLYHQRWCTVVKKKEKLTIETKLMFCTWL